MILIGDKVISDDVIEKNFVCNLDKCKGKCCVEGDFGAPLEDDERATLEDKIDVLKPYMTEEGIASVEAKGLFSWFEEPKEYGTTLNKDGSCAYLNFNQVTGISYCTIEKAWKDGKIDWRKPISCHLYPIRINKMGAFTALNYDKWDICSSACSYGDELKVPVYQFAKESLIRKFGLDFYEELEQAAAYHLGTNED